MARQAQREEYVAPWVRVLIMLTTLGVAAVLARILTGAWVPRRPEESAVFQGGLLLVVLGSAILEHKFTRPADSAVNALAGIITLVTVYRSAPRLGWWLVTSYCVVVFFMASTCIVVSTGPDLTGWRKRVAAATYQPAVLLGRARLLQSVVFLFAVFSFYGSRSRETAWLVVFWGLFVALWPLRVPQFLSRRRAPKETLEALGRVTLSEWPNLVRVALRPGAGWTEETPRLYQDGDGHQHFLVPLYRQVRDQQAIGTGLIAKRPGESIPGLIGGSVYALTDADRPDRETIAEALGGTPGSQLLGFVIENSNIGEIRFETWREELCREGLLVSCRVSGQTVYYQVMEGVTREESLESDRLGSQYAIAAQLGVLTRHRGFVKAAWLPTMNSAVFAASPDLGEGNEIPEGDFVFGIVPGSGVPISGPFVKTLDFHTAILGVTGSGKTELAFELIRHCVHQGIKVLCIDLTAKYPARLQDVTPRDLTISDDLARRLGERLFDVETGQYGAGTEKRALEEFRGELTKDVEQMIEGFLTSTEGGDRVGTISLNEISNTKATLHITELYLSCLLRYAKQHPDDCPRVLLVVEEAHTVMPEASTMGLGDYDSRGVVGKISQIALQGRKYGVGLLVVAQRTATVTKNVLTQCNTILALSSFDETSVSFLASVYGRAHAELLRDLPQLNAVVFGKAIRSERPVIVEIPYRPEKDPDRLMAPP